jgi:signal transduction histidine kinase/FixJ family two-component response regulator
MKRHHVIVVDDEPGIALLCERLLNSNGFSVEIFTDPRIALNTLLTKPCDLLLADIRMPQMSGFDLVQQVRDTQPEMAVLAMTGFGTVEMAVQALRRGVDGLLLKPFEKKELLESVHQAISDRQKKLDVARMQALRPLFSIVEDLFSETNPENLLTLILDTVSNQLRCTDVAFYRIVRKDKKIDLLAGRGNFPSPGKVDADGNIVERAAALEQPLWGVVGRTSDLLLDRELKVLKVGSAMVVPTVSMNMGSVLFAARDPSDRPLREAHLEMLQILARQATIAMENANLYGELRAYVQRVEESQRALVQSEKLASAGRLTASIAHEINNPLQSVRNCLHLAVREDLPPKSRKNYMDLTVQEVERLMMTVERMLDFYRPSVEFKPVSILDLLEHVLGLLGKQLEDKNIKVITAWPAELPSVMAISNQLEQVFINLVLNAFDAMSDGGNLWIHIAQKRKMIQIIFQDSGQGVPENMRDSIFEPFVSSKSGTGLGLAVSYDIVTAHGGQLDLLKQKPGEGAAFQVMLPIKDARQS